MEPRANSPASEEKTPLAWLETPQGDWIEIHADCPIGRMSDNTIVLRDDTVSRYHALIQHREPDEYWLVDLGSSNGTYHNQRRIRAPVPLHDRDQVHVGGHRLVFHQIIGSAGDAVSSTTVLDVKWVETWLLVADIEGSSRLQQTLPLVEARRVIHAWMSKARGIVEKNNGVVNQFLGDGVFAYWLGEGEVHRDVARALADFEASRKAQELSFRLAVHHGKVMTGGTVLGEENLHGPDVHFVFRMEQLAKKLSQSCLLSDAAAGKLGGAVRTVPEGQHQLPGFGAASLFHVLARDAGAEPERG